MFEPKATATKEALSQRPVGVENSHSNMVLVERAASSASLSDSARTSAHRESSTTAFDQSNTSIIDLDRVSAITPEAVRTSAPGVCPSSTDEFFASNQVALLVNHSPSFLTPNRVSPSFPTTPPSLPQDRDDLEKSLISVTIDRTPGLQAGSRSSPKSLLIQ
jgi:hypothetical protein